MTDLPTVRIEPVAGQCAFAAADAELAFWRDYLIQTRREIDLEKAEGTRILGMKLFVVVSVVLFCHGPFSVVAFALLPLALMALDRMHVSRLQYIIHRWEYLDAGVVPHLRRLLGPAELAFFESGVMHRNARGLYFPMEAWVRALLLLPVAAVSAVAVAASMVLFVEASESVAYLTAIAWLAALALLSSRLDLVYSRTWAVVALLAMVGLLGLDWLLPSLDVLGAVVVVLQHAHGAV